MSEHTNSNVDASQDGSISPSPPYILASQPWDGIVIEHHLSPPCEIPEHCNTKHIIVVHLQRPVDVELTVDGRSNCDRFAHGDISITPARAPVAVRFEDAAESVLLCLESELVARAAYESINADCVEIIPQFKASDELIKQLGIALLCQIKSEGVGDRLYAESIANVLAVHLLRNFSAFRQNVRDYTGGLHKDKLRRVTEYINDRLEKELSLAEIAKTVEMSPYHFARLFKQSTGLAPHHYVIERRIDQAKVLLAKKELTIAEISYQVGFQSQSHFGMVFRKLTGMTPTAYRKIL